MTEWLSRRSWKCILFILRGNIGTWCILVSCCFGHKLPQISWISTILICYIRGFPHSSVGKESQCRRPGFNSWVGKIPWRTNWQPTPVFLPGESPGQRRLVGNSPWGHKSRTWLSDYTTTINLWYYSSADHKFDSDTDGLKSTCWRGYICSGGCGEKSTILPFPSSWGCLGFLALGPLPSSIFRASTFHSLLLSYLPRVCYLGYTASSDLCTSLLKDPCEYIPVFINMGLPGWSSKDSACQCRRRKRPEFDPCVRKIPWRKKRQRTPVFLPRKCHGQRSLAGSSSRDRTVRHGWTANTFTFFCYGHWTFSGRETKFSPSASLS